MEKVDSDSYINEHTNFYGLRATVYESEVDIYGLQLAYEGSMDVDYSRQGPDKPKTTDIHRFMANLVVDGKEEYHILPYLFLGGGYESLSDEYPNHEVSQGLADIGIGFKYNLGYGFNTALEGRYIKKFDTRDDDFSIALTLGYTVIPSTIHQYSENGFFNNYYLNKKVDNRSKRRVTVIKVKPNQNEYREYRDEISKAPIARKAYLQDVASLPVHSSKTVEKVTSDTALTHVANKGYFVEVAALRTTSPQSIITKLNSSGYDNVVTKTKGDVTLVLVGPYDSKREASIAKSGLKSIASDAFIVHF